MATQAAQQIPIACDLTILSKGERERRHTLAAELYKQVREVVESADGYALRLDADLTHLRDTFELVLLERRCCPFLRFELKIEPAEGPIWLQLGGAPGVKEFLASVGFLGIGSASHGDCRS